MNSIQEQTEGRMTNMMKWTNCKKPQGDNMVNVLPGIRAAGEGGEEQQQGRPAGELRVWAGCTPSPPCCWKELWAQATHSLIGSSPARISDTMRQLHHPHFVVRTPLKEEEGTDLSKNREEVREENWVQGETACADLSPAIRCSCLEGIASQV